MGNVQYSAPTDPVQGSSSIANAMAAEPAVRDGRRQRPDGAGGSRLRESRSRRSRSGSRRRRAATSRASAGVARSTSCATAVECGTSPRTWLMSRVVCAKRTTISVSTRPRAADRLEIEALSAPELWDDPDRVLEGERRARHRARRRRPRRRARTARLEDIQTLFELARDEGDESVESEIAARDREDAEHARPARAPRSSAASTTRRERPAKCTPVQAAPTAQDWAAMLSRMFTRWAQSKDFTVEVDEMQEGQEAGITSATFIIKGRYAYGMLAGERGVHRLIRISPFDGNARRQTAFVVRLRSRARSDRGARHRSERSAHRHVPLVGRRRPARERHRLRGAHHALPTGDRGVVPERTVADAEQGQGDADPRGAARGASRARSTARRSKRSRATSETSRSGTRSAPTRSRRTNS